MHWIENNKSILNLLSAISAFAIVVALVTFRANETVNLERWQLGVALLPWLLFVVFSLPLVYLSSFKRKQSTAIRVATKIFFWLVVVGILTILVLIYGIFVF
jgi:hypothetical protein